MCVYLRVCACLCARFGNKHLMREEGRLVTCLYIVVMNEETCGEGDEW